jgi:hypothetical protein
MAPQRSARSSRAAALALFALAFGALLASVGLLLSGPVVGTAHAAASRPNVPARHAGSSNPTITWDGSMIFAGQNSGNPWGPVGEHAQVQGSNFPDGVYHLVLAAGDVNSDATVCSASAIPVGSPVNASGGSFTASFDWPSAANSVNTAYSICALNDADHTVASTQDSGPFTVLSASAPSISISPSSVAAGGSVTITGQNFVPEQSVLVYISPCTSCGAPKTVSATVQSTGHNTGSFTTKLTIPTSTSPASYFVGAISSNGVLSATEQSLVVVDAPTPTATATATATASPTAATSGSGGTTGGSGGDNNGLFITLGIVAIVLLALIAGLIAFLVTRGSSSPSPATPGSPYGAYPVARPYGAGPPPLPMPDLANDPAAVAEENMPVNYDDPTDPGLGTPRRR